MGQTCAETILGTGTGAAIEKRMPPVRMSAASNWGCAAERRAFEAGNLYGLLKFMQPTSTHYAIGTLPVTGTGVGVSGERLDEALSGPVAAIVFDAAGSEEIASLLDGVADTEFTRENLDSLLNAAQPSEGWRVGEALAESFLTECRDCHFPWPDSRDERKRGSSLPGADLVGFHREGEVDRFAFGEVKTSAENTYPPGAAYGRHGLKQQMEDLRDCREIREGLVRYLAHRAVQASWRDRFRSAATVYFRNSCEVRIFGLLVRDVPPHEDDLRARIDHLGLNCPAAMAIELIAIYLPLGRIASLASQVMASRPNGGTP